MHYWFAAVLLILLASIAVMAELLRVSLRESIYKYVNIGLVGGILWPNGFVREYFGILRMNVRAHLLVALVLALLCAAIGCAGYFADLL